jgi:hypothetical protein
MGDEEPAIDSRELRHLVLQPGDLPPVWVRFDHGRQVQADAPAGSRADPARFGRLDGWKARYRRPGTPTTAGPLVVESRADVFDDSEGADRDLDAFRDDARGGGGFSFSLVDAPKLGEESVAGTLLQGSGPTAVRFLVIAWRDENVMASVLVNGFARRTSLANALALARKQQKRIERAAGR